MTVDIRLNARGGKLLALWEAVEQALAAGHEVRVVRGLARTSQAEVLAAIEQMRRELADRGLTASRGPINNSRTIFAVLTPGGEQSAPVRRRPRRPVLSGGAAMAIEEGTRVTRA